jgi:molybdate-binding protein
MGASLTERRRVRDEGLRVVNRCRGGERRKLDLSLEEARAKFVPAAAVRRTVQTLFGITGHKGRVGGPSSQG